MIDRYLIPLLIALALVLFASITDAATHAVDLTVDPYTAVVEWSDGEVEDINVINPRYCDAIFENLLEGYDCALQGITCGWVPVGRRGVRPVSVLCRRGGPIPGGSCIVGKGGNC